MLTIQHKATFLRLANELSPENLCCDGEISQAQAMQRKRAILAQWRSLEKEVGYPIEENDVYAWHDEVVRYERAERAKELAALPQHPLLKVNKAGVWSREGRDGRTAYYIWGPAHHGKNYRLFSEFSYQMGDKEEIGQFDSLNAAVEAGEQFLSTITTESVLRKRPLWRPENVKAFLTRLPVGY